MCKKSGDKIYRYNRLLKSFPFGQEKLIKSLYKLIESLCKTIWASSMVSWVHRISTIRNGKVVFKTKQCSPKVRIDQEFSAKKREESKGGLANRVTLVGF
eukprot:TRINITY_DN22303_c0_g1_i1.p1 TRINITY_DN22303_c0_g1~~TRINITY_DN22303_c0_g1_i1.p1  ORF type:complete len:100 (+),score=9.27 TRINITY_DN22303_c0_g1_i1:241-540(+)